MRDKKRVVRARTGTFFPLLLSFFLSRWPLSLLPTFCAGAFVCSGRSRRGPRRDRRRRRERERERENERRRRKRRKKTAIEFLTAVRRPPTREPAEPLGQAAVPGFGAYSAAGAGRLAGRGVAAQEARGRAGGAEPAEQRGGRVLLRIGRGGRHRLVCCCSLSSQPRRAGTAALVDMFFCLSLSGMRRERGEAREK